MIKRTERAAAAVRYGLPARLTNVAAADFLNVTNSSIAQAIVFDAYVGGVYAEDHGLERARVWLLAYWDLLNAGKSRVGPTNIGTDEMKTCRRRLNGGYVIVRCGYWQFLNARKSRSNFIDSHKCRF
jgi:hypothetical protein